MTPLFFFFITFYILFFFPSQDAITETPRPSRNADSAGRRANGIESIGLNNHKSIGFCVIEGVRGFRFRLFCRVYTITSVYREREKFYALRNNSFSATESY